MGLPAQVSVKPTQLGLDLSLAECERHLLALAAKAEETGSALWLDMEDSKYVDRTLELYLALKKKHPSTGVALQAYLHRTPNDLSRLLPLKPVTTCEGAYDEPREWHSRKERHGSRLLRARSKCWTQRHGGCSPFRYTHLALIARIAERLRRQALTNQYPFTCLRDSRFRQRAS